MFLSRTKDNNKTNLPQRHTRDLSLIISIFPLIYNFYFYFIKMHKYFRYLRYFCKNRNEILKIYI